MSTPSVDRLLTPPLACLISFDGELDALEPPDSRLEIRRAAVAMLWVEVRRCVAKLVFRDVLIQLCASGPTLLVS